MCGRYIVVDTVETIEKRFNTEAREVQLEMNYNLGPGQMGPVITDAEPRKVQMFLFGMSPSWAKKQMYLCNARAEGDHNSEDDPEYTGAKGIIQKPAFRKPIRSQRCLVIASAFLEGPKDGGLSKPYLVYLQKGRPFALAGIWDTWNNADGKTIHSFAIITTTANKLLQTIGHHRMPVILDEHEEKTWLQRDAPLTDITHLLNQYPHELMNAYPVSPEIKNPRNNRKDLIFPIGERLQPEYEFKVTKNLIKQGWGGGRRPADE
jgi:putative SOS response-associated peptidase YedK